jgi:S1-C subfamily serine protease
VLVLLDEKTRPYYLNREWDEGFDGLQDEINRGQAARTERDRVLAAVERAAEADRLTAAAEATKWLGDRQLTVHYGVEIKGWLALARQADPDNAAGKLEIFLVQDLLVRLAEAAWNEDAPAVLAVLQELDPWFTKRFVNPDLGATMHMMAAQILLAADRTDLAERQMQQAITYQPTDKNLRDSLAGLRMALENKDLLGSGSGYLISSAGYVLTNHHVIEGEGRIEIRVPGTKDTVPAELIAQDPDRDIALLKVALPNPEKYLPLALAPDPVRRGAAVAAFGYPKGDTLGTGLKFTSGTISALPDEANEQMYLLDVTINPGNSGGPLCDRRGNVVGMITAKTVNAGFDDSYGLAVPSADLHKFLEQHLPPNAPRASANTDAASLDWDQIDEKVSGGVLMILKKK